MNEHTAALQRIASASPCVTAPGTVHERSCSLCLAMIDEARDALGHAPWPAPPGTPKRPVCKRVVLTHRRLASVEAMRRAWDNDNQSPDAKGLWQQ